VNRSHTTRERRRPLGALLLSALGVALVALALPAAAAAAPIYWGGTIKGDVYGIPGEAPTSAAVTQRFEEDTGKHISMVNTGQGWASFDAAIAAGTVPLVTMRLEGATLAEVISGGQDQRIEAWARAAKAFGYPFLFRPWWEVNGNWYSWGRSPEYVAAWRHFHDVVERVGATNVTWAWVVNTIWSDPESSPAPWYPGDGYVDWVGVDAYNWGENEIQPDRWLTAEESIQPTMDILRRVAPTKPVCICESASTEAGEGGQTETKAIWIHEMLAEYLPTHPEIKAYLWFNWNNEKEDAPGRRFDWQIESSAASVAAFRAGIASSYYLSAPPPLTKLAKVPLPGGTPTTSADAAAGVGGAETPTPAESKPPARRAPGADNRIAFGMPRLDPTGGTAKLPVWIPGAGTLTFSGKGIRVRVLPGSKAAALPLSRWIPKTSRLMLEVSATGPRRRTLTKQGEAAATVSARFSPLGGTPLTRRVGLTLRGG
jgi:hypothetical protein